jgi:hypothetical protein
MRSIGDIYTKGVPNSPLSLYGEYHVGPYQGVDCGCRMQMSVRSIFRVP